MQFTVEDQSTVKKILHIKIPGADVVSELDKAYADLKKTAKIKGFRPGKAPRSVLERVYRKEVRADVSSKLIQDSLLKALQESKLPVLGSPQVDPPELPEEGEYSYDAVVEVPPEIGTIDFKGLPLKRNLYGATDEEVETQLKLFQKRMAEQRKIAEDRPVQAGDFVLIDYEGLRDGMPFPETALTENFVMKLGEGHIHKDIDAGMEGMTPGETKEITVTFPQDHYNKALAGLTITVRVTLKEIREEVLPAIDDELAKKLGNFESLDQLKEKVRENLQQGYDKRAEQELNEQIFQSLIERTDFELPEILVQSELDAILSDAERSFQYHNTSLEELGLTREAMGAQYRETAEKQVRRHLILNQIIDQEKLEVPDDVIEKELQEMADKFHQPLDQIKAFYAKNPDRLEYFRHTLLEKEAIKLIIDNGSVEEVTPEIEKPEETEEA